METLEIPLPDSKDLPSIEDDGSKPAYSYIKMIGMSILRAPNRRSTPGQIYKWISDTFEYYKDKDKDKDSSSGDPGWQSSIRHNLSLNEAFVMIERPREHPGKRELLDG